MVRIVQVETDEHRLLSRVLLGEYLEWLRFMMNQEFAFDFDPKVMLEQATREDSKFSPPTGRMLLALDNDDPAGLICLRKLNADTGEIKRMYVRPEARGKGVGNALIARMCAEAQQIGYARIRLDSAPFMTAAHAAYRTAGFYEIGSYPESEAPSEFHANWLFMERTISS